MVPPQVWGESIYEVNQTSILTCDSENNKLSVTDPASKTDTYGYDASDRLRMS